MHENILLFKGSSFNKQARVTEPPYVMKNWGLVKNSCKLLLPMLTFLLVLASQLKWTQQAPDLPQFFQWNICNSPEPVLRMRAMVKN